MAIIKTPLFKGLGAAAVADIMASTGPPPKSEETASASPEYIVKWSILA